MLFQQQLDPEAARVANFPSRDRERFMTDWRTRVLTRALQLFLQREPVRYGQAEHILLTLT